MVCFVACRGGHYAGHGHEAGHVPECVCGRQMGHLQVRPSLILFLSTSLVAAQFLSSCYEQSLGICIRTSLSACEGLTALRASSYMHNGTQTFTNLHHGMGTCMHDRWVCTVLVRH